MPVTAEDLSVPAAELTIVGHYDKVAGYATRRAGGSPSWLLLWTEAGAGLVEQGGVSCEVGPGDLVVLGSGVAQHYRVPAGAGRWRFWWVHFQPRATWAAWLGPYARGDGLHLVAGVPAIVHERIGRAFERALQDSRWTPDAPAPDAPVPGEARVPAVVVGGPARELVMGAVEEALVLATASARPVGARRGEEGDERVRRVLAIIAAEPGAPHSVASLARAVALSPSRFAHLFAEETGQTPMQSVRQARVRHAAGLLEVTDLDVGQVAAASGFVSPFHFSRAFRREYGLPPRDYRARVRPVTG
ncbi:AraC family transcriptional regulator, arabinose operon regulatory protein [Nonomuraea solani]|uniref:AraC family transcriptional regulator, arabinose operon regulatory protein n=1 Tax=Nonomuraea solani TaxID=1144553 RepID=A0A1H6E206_9ACTN|nr:helix-turn-helix domain-containing protein [Nonomuraea solani]SEG91369.1 AraC family transcriptional regulator, arabinose operon regulatory protein [Nonomuraea solani]